MRRQLSNRELEIAKRLEENTIYCISRRKNLTQKDRFEMAYHQHIVEFYQILLCHGNSDAIYDYIDEYEKLIAEIA